MSIRRSGTGGGSTEAGVTKGFVKQLLLVGSLFCPDIREASNGRNIDLERPLAPLCES